MLARLDELIAPARSAVNREGTLLRIEDGDEGERIHNAVTSTVTEMGFIAQVIDQLPEDVSRWYSTADIDELSAEEARVLSDRWAQEIRDEGLLGGVSRSDLRSLLEGVLLTAFRHAAKTGIVRLDPQVRPEGMSAADYAQLREWLIRKLGGGNHLRAE